MDTVTQEEIIQAAKQANAYGFIMSDGQKILVNNYINERPK